MTKRQKISQESKETQTNLHLRDLPNIEDVFNKLPWRDLNNLRKTSRSFNKRIIDYRKRPEQKLREQQEREQVHEKQIFDWVLDETFGHLTWRELEAFSIEFPELNQAIEEYRRNN